MLLHRKPFGMRCAVRRRRRQIDDALDAFAPRSDRRLASRLTRKMVSIARLAQVRRYRGPQNGVTPVATPSTA